MSKTEVSGKTIKDGSIQRRDIDVTSEGQSLITKVIPGNNVIISSTGADAGTGDVTIEFTALNAANNKWLKWRDSGDLFYINALKVDENHDVFLNAGRTLPPTLETDPPQVELRQIFLQINEENALSITDTKNLRVHATNFSILGTTSNGADNQSITITPADADVDLATRGASVKIHGNEASPGAGSLVLESGNKSLANISLHAAAVNGSIECKINNSSILSLSPFAILANQSLEIPAGSLSSLPLSFTGDSNTGLYNESADSLAIVTGGELRVKVDQDGRVGIGNSSPDARLHVTTLDAATKGLIVKGAASQTANLIEGQNSSGSVVFAVSPTGVLSSGSIAAANVTGLATVATSGDYNDLNNTPDVILQSEKGVANGVATLDAGGLVPSSQLPSYVDDVLEHANLAAFPTPGEQSKIYVALDTNKIYRWTGSVYVEVSPGAGNSDTATKLLNARIIAATGDASWSVLFDGSQNVSNPLTLSDTGVVAGEHTKVTVDSKGRVTSGADLEAADIPNLDASKITSGVIDNARLPQGFGVPTGTIVAFAGSTAPSGWLICDGTLISQTTYANLFAVIGGTYNGLGIPPLLQFRLPDLRRRVPLGKGASDNLGDDDGLAASSRQLNHAHSVTVKGHHHAMTGAGSNLLVDISHTHAATSVTGSIGGSDGTHTHTAATGAAGAHTHSIAAPVLLRTATSGASGRALRPGDADAYTNPTHNIVGAGDHTHSVSVTSTNSGHGHSFSLSAGGQTLGTTNKTASGSIGKVTEGDDGNSDNTYASTPTNNVNYVIMNYIIKT
jgi:microcystin-dependent protein